MEALLLQLLLLVFDLLAETGRAVTFSSRLIHRFSEEVKALEVSRGGAANATGFWSAKRSAEYYQLLVASDFRRQRMKLGTRYELLFPPEGGKAMSLGNDFGWLHYPWIDVGTPNVAFLVALDAGAPLYMGQSVVQDRDLNEYSPSASSTSKHLTDNHQLCVLGPDCKSPKCGMNQSGGYVDGVAPHGLMGLGIGEISVPSFLAKSGLVQNSFSMCFEEDESGRIIFGDQGPVTQKYTPFLPLNGKYEPYILGWWPVVSGILALTNQVLMHWLTVGPRSHSYQMWFMKELQMSANQFERRVNATRSNIEGSPWKYCYKSSTREKAKVPSLTLMFPLNNSFVVYDPVFLIYGMEGVAAFCLAIRPADEDIGTIGHNFMTGYRVVFDRENLKLGWSRSNCQDLEYGESMPLSPNARPPNPLPTKEQESSPQGHVVAPAVAGRAPTSASAAAPKVIATHFYMLRLLLPLLLLHLHAHYHPLYSRTR